jgi:hypothetical protein
MKVIDGLNAKIGDKKIKLLTKFKFDLEYETKPFVT